MVQTLQREMSGRRWCLLLTACACFLNAKVLVGTFNLEKALVGAFSVIVKSSRTFVCSCRAGGPGGGGGDRGHGAERGLVRAGGGGEAAAGPQGRGHHPPHTCQDHQVGGYIDNNDIFWSILKL